MPGVVPVEDNKSQAVLVHTIDHDVAVTIGRLSTLDDQVLLLGEEDIPQARPRTTRQ